MDTQTLPAKSKKGVTGGVTQCLPQTPINVFSIPSVWEGAEHNIHKHYHKKKLILMLHSICDLYTLMQESN